MCFVFADVNGRVPLRKAANTACYAFICTSVHRGRLAYPPATPCNVTIQQLVSFHRLVRTIDRYSSVTPTNQYSVHCPPEGLRLQVVTREGALITQPEYVLRFAPPLTISNLLPFDIEVVVTDAASVSTATDPARFHIGVGGRAEVYQFDLTRKIRMSVCMQVGTPLFLFLDCLSHH